MEQAGMKLIKRVIAGGLDTIYFEITRKEFERVRR
jgi:hypothetical protein